MASNEDRRAFCVLDFHISQSVVTAQRNFRRKFCVDPPSGPSIQGLTCVFPYLSYRRANKEWTKYQRLMPRCRRNFKISLQKVWYKTGFRNMNCVFMHASLVVVCPNPISTTALSPAGHMKSSLSRTDPCRLYLMKRSESSEGRSRNEWAGCSISGV
ncbi:hypothetical protein ANN_17854 [Periplaneta americana]|uniref:DUF4817 domain-containing protein n=1 Tax=Periplaneta americana TaxID=6978 RepID=A0ABQ8SU42_PERAM|nr:hypothetical protein ANN_17854 [Periplaneta americana]